MRILEAIKKMEEIHSLHGNITLLVNVDGFGGHATYMSSDLKLDDHYIDSGDIEENGTSDECVKELLPDWDGNSEIDDKIDVALLYLGEMLSAT